MGKRKNQEIKGPVLQMQPTPNASSEKKSVIGRGTRSVKDIFAPPSIDRSNPDYIKVGKKYVRSFVVNGYPSIISVGWLDDIYSYDGDIDTSIYVEPADERGALDELTNKITQFEAQLATETEKGNIRNTTRLSNMIHKLYQQRERLEQNFESLFHVQIFANLYADGEEELNKQSQMLDTKLQGRSTYLMPVYLEQDNAYKSALPFGKAYITDKYRNFNSGALTACFPFYNSEISHKDGVFIGINLATMTPVLLNFYDRKVLNNANATVFGQAGSGKTFMTSLLILRSTLKGIRVVIIDPEAEYIKLTKAVGGSHVTIAPDSDTKINPFDLEEEDETDDDGMPTGYKVVRINDKVADVLNLVAVMSGGLTREQEAIVSTMLQEVYKEKGFTDDPKSLYITEPYFDEGTGLFYHDGTKKPMPTFSDFHKKLEDFAMKEENKELKQLANALKMFKKGGVYDMFDCQTSSDIDFSNSPIITFDISKLEESILRPIGMYISMSWTWERFIKKNPLIKKLIVCDEAWMLVSQSMAGNEYTGAFLEKCARRIRKRNGGLLVASQNFIEFTNSDQGRAVLTNAVVNIFLQQNATDIDAVQKMFKLSDGERNFLMTAKRGEMLIRMKGESSVAYAYPFQYEKELIEKNYNIKR